VDIKMQEAFPGLSPEGAEMAIKKASYAHFVKTLFYDKAEFVHEYIVNGKYKDYISQ
jgi:hypothetical protein